MQIEHTDLHAGYGHMYLMWNEPAVEPPGECLSTAETFRRLAAAHGSHRAVPVRLRPGAGRAAALLRPPVADGHHGGPAAQGGLGPAQRAAAVRALRRRLPDPLGEDGVRVSATAAYVPSHTASAQRGPYPLALITPASHMFLNTIFGNNPELAAALEGASDPGQSRGRLATRPERRAAGPGVQRQRRVRGRGGGQREGAARRGGLHQGPLAQAAAREARR